MISTQQEHPLAYLADNRESMDPVAFAREIARLLMTMFPQADEKAKNEMELVAAAASQWVTLLIDQRIKDAEYNSHAK